MNEKLPDDQTLWFRNIPPKESVGGPEEAQKRASKEPEIELFIEPLTGLAIPIPNQNKPIVANSQIIAKTRST